MASTASPYIRYLEKYYEAVLFDMDGTLVDSSAVVERVWSQWADDNGLDLESILKVSHGRRTIDTVRMFASPQMGPSAEAERLEAMEAADSEGVVAVEGAREFVGRLADGRWAVVTSAGRQLAERRLAAAGLPIPRILVTAEDVARGKPDPEGYRLAALQLGWPIDRCLVFEDAPAGVLAGISAGCDVILINASQPVAFEPSCWEILE